MLQSILSTVFFTCLISLSFLPYAFLNFGVKKGFYSYKKLFPYFVYSFIALIFLFLFYYENSFLDDYSFTFIFYWLFFGPSFIVCIIFFADTVRGFEKICDSKINENE